MIFLPLAISFAVAGIILTVIKNQRQGIPSFINQSEDCGYQDGGNTVQEDSGQGEVERPWVAWEKSQLSGVLPRVEATSADTHRHRPHHSHSWVLTVLPAPLQHLCMCLHLTLPTTPRDSRFS